jgi:capsular exopolysaccharide synthesis family protein
VAAFGLEALDRRLKSPEDVEKKLSLRFLGALPHLDRRPRAAWSIAEHRTSIAAERCRLIGRNLLLANPLRRVMVTSSVPREGKTLTSINLAIAMAQSGSRVLLVDCDLRRPGLSSAIDLGDPIGLTSVICGGAALDEAIRPTAVPNLYVLPAGPLPTNPAELADSAQLGELLEECSRRFDRVLLDTSPLLAATDAALVARHCDGVVMVVRAGRTTVDHARSARQTLTSAGATVLGVVLNDLEIKDTRFSDRYRRDLVIDEQPDAARKPQGVNVGAA